MRDGVTVFWDVVFMLNCQRTFFLDYLTIRKLRNSEALPKFCHKTFNFLLKCINFPIAKSYLSSDNILLLSCCHLDKVNLLCLYYDFALFVTLIVKFNLTNSKCFKSLWKHNFCCSKHLILINFFQKMLTVETPKHAHSCFMFMMHLYRIWKNVEQPKRYMNQHTINHKFFL